MTQKEPRKPTAEERSKGDEYFRQLSELDFTNVLAVMAYVIEVSAANQEGVPLRAKETVGRFTDHGFKPGMGLPDVDFKDALKGASYLIGVFLKNLQEYGEITDWLNRWLVEWKETFGTGSES